MAQATQPTTAADRVSVRRPDRRLPHYTRRTLVIFSQVFVPDPASVGQHIADVAVEMVRRGCAWSSTRPIADTTTRRCDTRARENYRGVEVRPPAASHRSGRNRSSPAPSAPPASCSRRSCAALTTPNLGGIFFSTSPPLIGFAATIVKMFRTRADRVLGDGPESGPADRDGQARPRRRSPPRFSRRTNRIILKNASLVDRARPLHGRAPCARASKHRREDGGHPALAARDARRAACRTTRTRSAPSTGSRASSSSCTAATTARRTRSTRCSHAAERFKDDRRCASSSSAAGSARRRWSVHRRAQAGERVSLPYQPLADLRYSLGAADVHVVSLGDDMVGIIHPCKVYGAMAVARPVLFFGPKPSHISDLLDRHNFGVHVGHGEDQKAIAAINYLRQLPRSDLESMGKEAQRVLGETLSQELLCGQLCDGLELIYSAVIGESMRAFLTIISALVLFAMVGCEKTIREARARARRRISRRWRRSIGSAGVRLIFPLVAEPEFTRELRGRLVVRVPVRRDVVIQTVQYQLRGCDRREASPSILLASLNFDFQIASRGAERRNRRHELATVLNAETQAAHEIVFVRGKVSHQRGAEH